MANTTKELLEEIASYPDFQDFLNEQCDLILAPTTNRGLSRAVTTELGINTLPSIRVIKLCDEGVTLASDGKYFIIMDSNTLADTIYQRKDFVKLVEFEFKDKAYKFPLEVLEAVLILERDHATEWLKNLKRV